MQPFKVEFKLTARRRLEQIKRRNPKMANMIGRKIQWLAHHVRSISHEHLVGHDECSVHCAQYRILYQIDRENRRIITVDMGKHDEVYQRLRRRS